MVQEGIDFIKILRGADPLSVPLYIMVFGIILAVILWRFLQKTKIDMIAEVKTFFDEHKEDHKKLDFIIESKPKIDYLVENFEIVKKTVDNNKISSNTALYKFIDYELQDLKNRFIRNYNNGSQREKALQELSICQQKLLTTLNSAMIKSIDRKSISILIEFIFKKLVELTGDLQKLQQSEALSKLNLVNVYFNNLLILVSFFSLKEIDYINKEDKDLIKILDNDFKKLAENLMINRRPLSEEY